MASGQEHQGRRGSIYCSNTTQTCFGGQGHQFSCERPGCRSREDSTHRETEEDIRRRASCHALSPCVLSTHSSCVFKSSLTLDISHTVGYKLWHPFRYRSPFSLCSTNGDTISRSRFGRLYRPGSCSVAVEPIRLAKSSVFLDVSWLHSPYTSSKLVWAQHSTCTCFLSNSTRHASISRDVVEYRSHGGDC